MLCFAYWQKWVRLARFGMGHLQSPWTAEFVPEDSHGGAWLAIRERASACRTPRRCCGIVPWLCSSYETYYSLHSSLVELCDNTSVTSGMSVTVIAGGRKGPQAVYGRSQTCLQWKSSMGTGILVSFIPAYGISLCLRKRACFVVY